MAVKNITASVLARLKNQAKEQNISFQICLQLFLQEEFLRRLSASKYRDNFILKGGMFIYTLTDFESRPTRDMDFLVRKLSSDLDNIKDTAQEICSVKTEYDYINIAVTDTENITVNKKYPGVKIKLIGRIDNLRIPFSIDVGIDDIIVPSASLRKITTRLEDFSNPEVLTYSIESTVAEKFDAILQLMETTSRMKDFYDIYYLSGMFDFEGKVLKEAIEKTTQHREHEIMADVFERINGFKTNSFLLTHWKAFAPAADSKIGFETVIDSLTVFLEPVVSAIIKNKSFDEKWNSAERSWNK